MPALHQKQRVEEQTVHLMNLAPWFPRVLALALSALTACASSRTQPQTTTAPPSCGEAAPIPRDLQEQVALGERLGYAIYVQHMAGSYGAEIMRKNVDPKALGIGGWLAMRAGDEDGRPLDHWYAWFFTQNQPYAWVCRAHVGPNPANDPLFVRYNPPEPVDELGATLIAARQNALHNVDSHVGLEGPFSAVVLPGVVMNRAGILVYVLANPKPGQVAVGPQFRTWMSEDGTKVLEHQALSPTSRQVAVPTLTGNADCPAVYVTHVVSDTPLETHAFLSMLHKGVVFRVKTPRGLWRVEDGRISFVSPEVPPPLLPAFPPAE